MPAFLFGGSPDATLRKVRELKGERIGIALRQLAEDLVSERRRVALLERQNHELRQELEELRRSPAEEEVEAALSG